MFDLKTLAFATAAAVLSIAAAFPATAQVFELEEHCVVNVKSSDALNVRSEGNPTSQVVTTLRYGECGVIVMGACKGSWCPIEDGHFSGWVNSRFISMVSPAMYCVTGVKPGDSLNLRAYPTSGSRVLTQLSRNQCDISFLPYATESWQKVRVEGVEGWANRKFLSGQ